MSGYGSPCSGEIEFWSVAKSQFKTIAMQLTRIAAALETANARRSGPNDIRVGDIVTWTDPEGGYTTGWTVVQAPPYPNPNGVYTIRQEDGTTTEMVFGHELTLVKPGGAK